MTSPTGRRAGGFTLLELLVVLAIISLLATIMPVGGPTWLLERGVDRAALSLAADLRGLRDRAQSTGFAQMLKIAADGNSYSLAEQHVQRQLSDGVRITYRPASASADSGALRFSADGTASGGIITISDSHRARHLEIGPLTGRVSLK